MKMRMFYRQQMTPSIRLFCLRRIAHNCGSLGSSAEHQRRRFVVDVHVHVDLHVRIDTRVDADRDVQVDVVAAQT